MQTEMSEVCGGMGFVQRTVRLRKPVTAPAEPSSWTPAQASVLAHEAGGLLVLGGPGTGKTSLAVAAAAKRLELGQRALVLTVSRQAASEVRDRVTALSARTSIQPSAMTVHSLCRIILSRFTDEPGSQPRLLTAPEQEFRIREILAGRGAAAWPESLEHAYSTGGFAQQVRGAIARVRQLGLDPADVMAAGERAGDPVWFGLGDFMDEYLDVMDAEQAIDYAELVHRVRLLLERPEVVTEVSRWFDAVWVDDLPEFDPAQLALVRSLARDGVPTVGLADPDSAIFRFRGAHPKAAAEFARLFGADVVQLGESFRLSEPIAQATTAVARRLPLPLSGGEYAGFRDINGVGDGQIQLWSFPNGAAQSAGIAAALREEHLDSGLAWSDMAVLVRSGNDQIPPLARALVHAGIPVDVAGDEMGLARDPAVRPLLIALQIAATSKCDGSQVIGLLTSGWGEFDSVDLRVLGRALGQAGLSPDVAESTSELLRGHTPMPELDATGRASVLLQRLGSRVQLINQARRIIDGNGSAGQALWELWSRTAWPNRLASSALSQREGSQVAHRTLDAVLALFSLAEDWAVKGGRVGVQAFLDEVAGHLLPADDQRESSVRGSGVQILTAHRAKGRQWPFVVVAGVQEGSWPDVRRRGSLLDPQRLTSGGLGLGTTTGELISTERRLFHLACTRAARRLLVTAISGTGDDSEQPSRFFSELGVTPSVREQPSPRIATLRGLVVSLRSTAEDPSAEPGLRQAALNRLARLSEELDEQGNQLVPDADPEKWWGLHQLSSGAPVVSSGRVRLSPSRLTAILTCPRQYFLNSWVKAQESTPNMILGSVLHGLVERMARGELDLQQAISELELLWPAVGFRVPWASAAERDTVVAALERFAAWQEAHAGADVVGVEAAFSFELEAGGLTVEIVGKADRVERTPDGALRVFDFKSSKKVVTAKEASEHAQLGLYQLAVESGAFEGIAPGASHSAGASLVFLRVDDKGLPKLRHQDPLGEHPRLADDPIDDAHPTWVHARVDDAVTILREGRFDATPGRHCEWCPFKSSCPAHEEGSQVTM